MTRQYEVSRISPFRLCRNVRDNSVLNRICLIQTFDMLDKFKQYLLQTGTITNQIISCPLLFEVGGRLTDLGLADMLEFKL